jgi:hypothetical protein
MIAEATPPALEQGREEVRLELSASVSTGALKSAAISMPFFVPSKVVTRTPSKTADSGHIWLGKLALDLSKLFTPEGKDIKEGGKRRISDRRWALALGWRVVKGKNIFIWYL